MPTDINIWKKRVKDAVNGIANEELQRRSWFGKGPEIFSPEEMFCQFFDDASIKNFLDKNDNGLNQKQIAAGKHLIDLMNQLGDKAYQSNSKKFADPAQLIDDPLLIQSRAAAKQFLALL